MKKYTEEDLRKLVDLIDDSYRPYTRDNFQGSNVLEEFLRGDFDVKTVEEDKIPFCYSFLCRKLEWEDFCRLTGIDYYATRNGFEIKDSELFYITESNAKKYNLF